ncbi:MAG: hypothetical protein ACTHNH_21220 [Mesorhizobium sp.]
MNAHAKIEPISRADQIVEQINANIRAFNASPRQSYNPLDAHREALEMDMSWQACTGPAAAILKLGLIESVASSAFSHIEDEWHRSRVDDTVSRQIGTIIRWLEREFGISPDDPNRDYYHPDYSERRAWCLNPKDDTVVLP